MAITWADVLEWETGPLDSIAADLGEVSQGLRSAHATGENALGAIRSEGLAVTTMRATTTSNLESLEQAATNVNDALMAIEGARDGVATIKANAEDAQAYASAHNCTIAADGAVTCTPTDDTDPQAVFEARSAMMTLMYEVASILDDAERVDSELSSALSAISADPHASSIGVVSGLASVPIFPESNRTPAQNAAWWKSLPEERKRFLIEHCPDDIRHLDGLPAEVRDKANRNALEGYVDADGNKRQGALKDADQAAKDAQRDYDIAHARRSADPRSEDLRLEEHRAAEKLRQAQEAREDLKTIHEQTNKNERGKDGPQRAYLLDFNYDTKHHRTTAIVASGNPDTASYVSTLVPGIGTNVHDSLGQYIDINDRLRAQTRHAGVDPNDVATISYLGYVAPKNSLHDLGIFQAADIDYAKEGAPKIARFMEGLRAHGNANNHRFINTLATHSYGSTTGGIAATQTAPGTIDRLILTGSPGSGVQSIDQYNVPKGHVYESSVPENDMVQDLGFDSTYGRDPKKLEGITHLSGDATDSERYKPIPPANERWAYPTGQQTPHPLSNHSTYFDWGTRTSQDFAHIIAGKEPTTEEEWEWLRGLHKLNVLGY